MTSPVQPGNSPSTSANAVGTSTANVLLQNGTRPRGAESASHVFSTVQSDLNFLSSTNLSVEEKGGASATHDPAPAEPSAVSVAHLDTNVLLAPPPLTATVPQNATRLAHTVATTAAPNAQTPKVTTPEGTTFCEWARSAWHNLFTPRIASPRDLIHELSLRNISSDAEEAAAPRLNAPAAACPMTDLGADFQVTRHIDHGGFGNVDHAIDLRLQRDVAIKTIHADKADRNSQRSAFLTEARLMAYLDHPSILPVYDLYADHNNSLNLVMKLIRGSNLKALLKKTITAYRTASREEIRLSERRLLPERLEVFIKVCNAIAYAHHKGVLHRDLKPENIMVGNFGEVYVMDWGIAEHQSIETLAHFSGRVAGTLKYIAPELIAHRPYDSRSDIYSLGMILFEIVFLKPAYPSGSDADIRKSVLEHNIQSYSHAFGIHVERALKLIIDKAIRPSPAARYQNVRNFADDIGHFLRIEPVAAEPNPFIGMLNRIRRKIFG